MTAPTVTATVFRDLRVRLSGDLPAGLVAFGRPTTKLDGTPTGSVVIDCVAGNWMPLVPVLDFLIEAGREVRGLEFGARRLAG